MRFVNISLVMMLGLSVLSYSGSVPADGGSKYLKGVYGMSFSQTCMLAPIQPPPSVGFDEQTKELLVDAEVVSAVSNGLVHFQKGGKLVIRDAQLTEIFNDKTLAGNKAVGSRNKYSCAGDYQFTGKSKISAQLSCSVHIPVPGVAATIEPFLLEGYVSKSKEFVNLTALEGNVQKYQLSVGGQIVEERQRVCLQTLNMGKLEGHDD